MLKDGILRIRFSEPALHPSLDTTNSSWPTSVLDITGGATAGYDSSSWTLARRVGWYFCLMYLEQPWGSAHTGKDFKIIRVWKWERGLVHPH
jgi:hypothetical protein